MNTLNAVSLISWHGITVLIGELLRQALRHHSPVPISVFFHPSPLSKSQLSPEKGKALGKRLSQELLVEQILRTVQGRKRDNGVTNRRYKPRSPDCWSLLLGMWGFSRFSFESFFSRNVGFFPFQFRIVLAALPLFKERHLAIPLSVSLKLSFSPAFWVSNPREFCHYTKIWPSVWINPPRESDLVWFISFVSSET